MEIKELKNQIESKDITDSIIIFRCEDSHFLANQYINEISRVKSLQIEYVDDINSIGIDNSFFGTTDDSLRVVVTDSFGEVDRILSEKNLIIVCNKCPDIYNEYIVNVPKLETWQIIDYLYSYCEGVDTNKLDNLAKSCNYNIDRLSNEVEKISMFDVSERQSLFDAMVDEGAFSDVSGYNIFNFTNAVLRKDYNEVSRIYREIDSIDIEPVGLLTTLVNNFRDIITIQLSNNPTPETTGMQKGKFWAVYKYCGLYNKEQLVDIFGMLTTLDRKIKTGDINVRILIDYIVEYILTS